MLVERRKKKQSALSLQHSTAKHGFTAKGAKSAKELEDTFVMLDVNPCVDQHHSGTGLWRILRVLGGNRGVYWLRLR